MSQLLPTLAISLPVLVLGCASQPSALNRPNRLLLVGEDRALVSDFHAQRLVLFDQEGHALESWGRQGLGRDGLWQVYALALDPAGGGVWVANMRLRSSRDPTPQWEVKRFHEGREQEVHGLPPADPEGGQWVESLLPVTDGWWIVDSQADALVHYDESWRPVETLRAPLPGPPGDAPQPFLGLAAAHWTDGVLWTVEQRGHCIRALDAEHRQILSFGDEGREPGQLRFPQDLAVCPGRWLAVADLGNYRVQRFDLQGRYLDGFEPTPASPDQPVQLLDIQVSPDCGRLYLVDSKGGRVLVTTPEGALLQIWAQGD